MSGYGKIPRGDTHHRHPASHHSDHSGAHFRGTSHHMKNAENAHDGLTEAEKGPYGHNAGAERGDHDTSHGEPPKAHADKALSDHPSEMELPALEEGRAG